MSITVDILYRGRDGSARALAGLGGPASDVSFIGR